MIVERTRWPQVALLIGCGIVVAIQIGKVPAALALIRPELGIGLVAAGWIIAIFNLLGMVVAMPLGAVADRFGHRRFVLLGLALAGLSSLAGSAASGPASLLASRFFEGLGFMLTVVAVPTLLARATRPADTRFAFGCWACYMPGGQALMLLFAPTLIETLGGWRGLWQAAGLVPLLYAGLVAWATRDLAALAPVRAEAPGALWRNIRLVATQPGPLMLTLAFTAYAGSFLAMFGFLPTILIEGAGLTARNAALLTALGVGCNVGGNIFGGWLLGRGTPRWLLLAVASLSMMLCGIGIYDEALAFGWRYGLVLLFSASGGLLPAAALGGAAAHAPTPQLIGTTTGMIVQGGNVGQTLAPPALAAVHDLAGSWAWSPLVLGLGSAVGLGAALRLRRLGRG